MNIFIDKEKLTSVLRDLHLLTGFRVGVFDAAYQMIAVYPEEHGDYCTMVRRTKQGLAQCDACDREACQKSSNLGQLVVYRCHAGLGEAVLPLYRDNTVIGYVIMGEMRLAKIDLRRMEEVWKHLSTYGLDEEQLRHCYLRKRMVTDEVAQAAANILKTCSVSLYLDGMITVRDLSIAERLDSFLNENLDAPLSVEMLCDTLSISKARLYSLFEKRYGMGVAEYVRLCRIRKAKQLLAETSMSISEVVARCGFADYNYFSKVFKKYCSMSPREYRKSVGIDDIL